MVGTALRAFAHPAKSYRIVIARPLRSAFAIKPTWWPVNSSTAPFWLVSTIARAAADRKARAGRAVDAGNVGGAIDVADAAAQHRLRAAEHQAVVEAAGRQRIAPPVEVQHAAAAGAADDPSRLVDRELHKALVGMRGRGQRDAGQGRKRK